MFPRLHLNSLLPILALAALAGVTYWLLQATLPPPGEAVARPKTHSPDYFADNFSVTELDQSGATQYRLTATKLIHYEDDETSQLSLPAMRAFQPGKPVVTATSKRGTVNGDVSIVDLYDDARILRAAGGDPPIEADSEHFRVLVNDDVIETEKPVKLQRGLSIANATNGMKYNNVTRVIDLYGNVCGTIAASDVSGGPSGQSK
ncbi:MAG: LPS export ABC transporter periplasmic protein LptC [Burkholderia sp.]